ncbi:MAG: LytR C-terminal domain-containing protein [bacterium]|nr:LytR C-terminal domain-containing protein [bacterium]
MEEEATIPSFQKTAPDSFQTQPQERGSRRFALLVLVVIILGVVVFSGVRFIGSRAKKEVAPTPTPILVQSVPTETPTPTSQTSPAPTKAPTLTPKPTLNPVDPASGLDRSSLSVEVKNGGGVAGTAGKASDFLKNLGYKVSAIGNADNFDYQSTVIEVKSAKSSFLSLLKKDLSASYTIGSTSADLSATSSADALVIVGK